VINKAMSISGLRPIDRVLGVAFGAARGTVLLLAVTLVVGFTPVRNTNWWLEAQGPLLAEAALAGLKPLLPGGFAKFLP
jgi:membrane protein required for colicin V production